MLNLASLNQRVNALASKINNIPVPPVADTLSAVLVAGNSAGATDINMNNKDILAVDNINLTTINNLPYPPAGGSQNITQVLTVGNNALDVSQTFSATGSPTTTNIDDAEVEIIDGTSGINTKLEYDRLTLTGNYIPYNTNNIVSNTGMVVSATDNLNNIQYNTSSTYTDLNIQRQPQTTFQTETTGTNFIDGVFYQTNNTFTSPTDNTRLSMKSSSTAGTITCYNVATSTSAPLDFQASALTLNGAPFPVSTPDLTAVLTAGNNASLLSITGLNNVDLSTINSTSYPPATPSWDTTLSVSNVAFQDINMNFNDILNCDNINLNTINGLSPTVIGLNWADFTGTNAYANLPNNVYEVFSSPNYTRQYSNSFEVYETTAPSYTTLGITGMNLVDITSGTSTTYGSNNIQSTNATAFTITAGSGASQILNLNCSQLVINGSAYPPAIPTLRQLFYSNNSGSFSVSSGIWATQGTAYTFNLQPNTGYIMSVNFSLYTSTYEATSAMYLETFNSNGFYPPSTYTNGRPVAQTGANNTFSTGGSGTSQFVFNDIISFTTDNNGQLIMDLYLGHNSGTWAGNYYWSMFANILSP
jgi:hypothetical protein